MYKIIQNFSKALIAFSIVFLVFAINSCKKFVEIPPPTGIVTTDAVFTTNSTAIAVLNDLFNQMNSFPIQGNSSISFNAGLSADEYTLSTGVTSSVLLDYYKNTLMQSGATLSGAEHWAPLYNLVFRCNAAIEGLGASTSLTPLVKQQLLGEAKVMRAFFYFYLVNEFGDVPLTVTTDPKINTLLARSPKASIYQQIITDLQEAEDQLNNSYVDGTLLVNTNERTRPTKWAAKALLARVYLYTGDYAKAEAKASEVVNNSALYNLLPVLNDVFQKNSKEAIWQIQPTTANYNTFEALTLIIPPTGPDSYANPLFLSDELVNSFEAGDQRAVYGNWINNTIYNIDATTLDTVAYPFKYKINLPNTNISGSNALQFMAEYFMVLRLAEQYLIRAEARAHLGNISGAQSDLNAIRNRAGLANTTASDQASLITAILNERRHELFSEWGHRWFDLKRTGKIDEVMTVVTPQKSGGTNTWKSYQQLYPLPLTELQRAPNLKQNPGYN